MAFRGYIAAGNMYSPKHLFWEESLATGDTFLDTQHKYLIEICNDLAKAIEKRRGQKIVGMVIDVLSFYAETHFKKEEECMERYHCTIGERNQKAHAVFLQKLKTYKEEYGSTAEPDQLAVRIHQYLSEWIVSHILHVDSQLNDVIQQNPAGLSE